jgi:TatA/E family protein of Tat protein translocase
MQMTPAVAFLGGGIGPGELVVIAVVVLLLFGPKRLPEIARTLGRVFDQFRRASQDFKDEVMRIDQPPAALPPPAASPSSLSPEPPGADSELEDESMEAEAPPSTTDAEPDPDENDEPKGQHELAG